MSAQPSFEEVLSASLPATDVIMMSEDGLSYTDRRGKDVTNVTTVMT